MAVPRRPRIQEALDKGNRLKPSATCIHWVNDPASWLEAQKDSVILAVELTDESVRLADLKPARPQDRTIMLLGNEGSGVPPEGMDYAQYAVEIPMIGTGSSLNVAVAGSLVLYRLAGLL
jgi:tRNA (guanosine-2'-O-)-methyltransferase